MGPNIEICQPGYDVRNCPDWAYLFNGGWPNLAIAFEITLTVTGGFATVDHNLGFPPLTMAWFTNSGESYGRVPADVIDVDDTTIYINNDGDMTIRCYNIDISVEQSYPLPQGAQAKLPYDNQFGAKIVKSGRYITSNNLNDFVLHTRAQSPAVLDVATQAGKYFTKSSASNLWPYGTPPTGGWDLIVYPLKTPYIPWCTGAIFDGGTWILISGMGIWYDSTTQSLVINITGGTAGSLIILRDPLFYPNVLQVVY